MASELIDAVFWINVSASFGILAVLAVRNPMRRRFGARAAYLLWLAPLLSAGAWLIPAREVILSESAFSAYGLVRDGITMAAGGTSGALPVVILALWLAGALTSIAIFAGRQQALRRAIGQLHPLHEQGPGVWLSSGEAGPFVLGVLRPRIIVPANFLTDYSPGERALVLAHERTHLRRHDPAINTAMVVLRSLFWFNPLVHAAASRLAADQEFSCDAAVLEAGHHSRRRYAELILKSCTAGPAPLAGCSLFSPDSRNTKERILMLKSSRNTRRRFAAGFCAAVATAMLAGTAISAARPAEIRWALESREASTNAGPQDRPFANLDADWGKRQELACAEAKGNFAGNALMDGLTAAQLALLTCIGLPEQSE
ncbi:MAG TPA: M56 family metallopeptidase [Micropepsaceae bacterium]|nr:M56 family metallopeptidase [Micropepsaceae bacterium]